MTRIWLGSCGLVCVCVWVGVGGGNVHNTYVVGNESLS